MSTAWKGLLSPGNNSVCQTAARKRDLKSLLLAMRKGGESRRQKLEVKPGQCSRQKRAAAWQNLQEERWLSWSTRLFSSCFLSSAGYVPTNQTVRSAHLSVVFLFERKISLIFLVCSSRRLCHADQGAGLLDVHSIFGTVFFSCQVSVNPPWELPVCSLWFCSTNKALFIHTEKESVLVWATGWEWSYGPTPVAVPISYVCSSAFCRRTSGGRLPSERHTTSTVTCTKFRFEVRRNEN